MQNQIFRNNIGESVKAKPHKSLNMSFAIFFSLIVFICSALSFASGFIIKSYIKMPKQKSFTIHKLGKTKGKIIDNPKYDINLGTFTNKVNAEDFLSNVSELQAAIEKTPDGYIVKLKDKFSLKHALSTAKTIRSEYKIIATIIERTEQ